MVRPNKDCAVFKTLGAVLLGVLLFGPVQADDAARNDGAKVVRFCALPAAMPRSGKTADGTAEGLDLAVAQLIAKNLGRPLEIHWCGSPTCSWNCLREKRCDVVLGQPHNPEPSKDIAWSVPYAGSHFGLVVAADTKGVRSLADLRGKRVGVVAGTVALAENDHQVARFPTREDLLDQFDQARLDAAFLDADFAAWYLHQHPKLGLRLVADFVPRERWNMALAVRAGDATLLEDLNRALSKLAEESQIKKAFADLGVTHRAPFTDNARRTLATDAWRRIKERGELAVSMDPANLPYSSAKGDKPGFDVELARALAERMGLKLRLHWIDVQRETAIGELLDGECDLAFGAAIDPAAVNDEEELAGKVIYSRPYYGTGYLLVVRKQGPRVQSLAELKGEKSRRLGTEAGSVADYHLAQNGYQRRLFRTQLAVLKALQDNDIDYGYLWANVGWTLQHSPDFALEIVPNYVPVDRWNIAIAMRHADNELKKQVDAALEKLVDDGTVSRALARYHVPYFPPFAEAEKKAEVLRHPVPDRGLEPQMGRKQTSRNSYSGLARVQSAGTLIVGLDHNNLPLSAAHREPAGLDYEIAQLLARKLDVSLKVYWAYSQHDSYPSKLASKNLCDVILGVMPDDRFGQRVLYSRPYYYAAYLPVVRAGVAGSSVAEPVAVEPGVVVTGLGKREVRHYPGLEEILEAVAAGREQAGYVISTRGPWLAAQRWPGKLHFLDSTDAADRFPICAAVRKTDNDLKDALDRAFAGLAKSGELARVFARWHVPYLAPDSEGKPAK